MFACEKTNFQASYCHTTFKYHLKMDQNLNTRRRCSGKEPPADAGDAGDTGAAPRPGRRPGEGNGHPLALLPGKAHGQRSLSMRSQRVGHD